MQTTTSNEGVRLVSTGENLKFDIKQAATYLKRKVSTVRVWMSNGDHPRYHKEFNRVFFYKHDIDAWIMAKTKVVEARVAAFYE